MRWAALLMLVSATAAAEPDLAVKLAVDSTRPLRVTITAENTTKSTLHIHDGPDNQAPWELFVIGKPQVGCSALTRLDPDVGSFDLAPGKQHVVRLECTLSGPPLLPGGDYDVYVDVRGDVAFVPQPERRKGWWEHVARSPSVKVHADPLPAPVTPDPKARPGASSHVGAVKIVAGSPFAELHITYPGARSISPGKTQWLSAQFSVEGGDKPAQIAAWAAWVRDRRGALTPLGGTVSRADPPGGPWNGVLLAKQTLALRYVGGTTLDLHEGDRVSYVIELVDVAGHGAFVETAPVAVTHDPKHDTFLP